MLSESAIIIVPTVQATTLKVTDKSAGAELTKQKGAAEKSARVVKTLIDPLHLKPILAVQAAFRTYLQGITVPWFGDACLLPKTRYQEFLDKVSQFRDDLDKEVDNFVRSYANLIEQAHSSLGELFDSSAYPDVFDLRSKFSISVSFMPVPDVNQFHDLGFESASVDKLIADALAAENEMLKQATENLFKRVQTRISLLHNRLTDPETKRYRESLVEGLQVLVDTLPELNILHDPMLDLITVQIKDMLSTFTMDEVRSSEEIRKDVAAQCDEILAKMSGMF